MSNSSESTDQTPNKMQVTPPSKRVHRPPPMQTPPSPRLSATTSPRRIRRRKVTDASQASETSSRRASCRSMRAPLTASPREGKPRLNLQHSNTEGRLSPRAFRYSVPSLTAPTINPDDNSYVEKTLKKKLPLNLEQYKYDNIIFLLSNERRRLAASHMYGESEKYSDAIEYARECQIAARKKILTQTASQHAGEELSKTVQRLSEFDEETRQLEKKIDDEEKEAKRNLDARHKKEIEENQELWQSDTKVKNYNRATNALTNLKKQINSLTIQCRFKDAEEAQEKYRMLKAEEEAASFERMQHDFDECLLKILDKHKEENEDLATKMTAKRGQLRSKRMAERKRFEIREAQQEMQREDSKDPEKVWARASTQRKYDSCKIKNSVLPSTKVAKKDITDPDFEFLTLPPLNFNHIYK